MYQMQPLLYMLKSPECPYLVEASTAYVMVNCKDGMERAIHEKLRETSYICDVIGTYGSYDIIAKIVSPTLEDLRDTLCKIRKIDNIRSTTTLICLSAGLE